MKRPSLYLVLLWLVGVSLRITVLAVAPLLPAIHHTLHLDETAVGTLTGLPVLLLAVGAVPGSLLVARLGPRRALTVGLLTVSLAGALRGIAGEAGLFVMTFVMGLGIAVSQPALPTLVREWLPQRVGLATALYSNGFLIGELLAAALTASFLLAVTGSWQLALAAWSGVSALALVAVLLTTPHKPRLRGQLVGAWWPDWSVGLVWRLGLILGGASASYWGINAFIPDYLRVTHHASLISPALTVVNVGQLPASILVGAFPNATVARRWPLALSGAATFVGVALIPLGGLWVVLIGGMLGLASASVLVLTLALLPLMAAHDTHRVSAAVFTISYACPFIGSFLSGAAWDASGIPLTAFLPEAAAGLLIVGMTLGLRLPAGAVATEEVAQMT